MPYTAMPGVTTQIERAYRATDTQFPVSYFTVATTYVEAFQPVRTGINRTVSARYDKRVGRKFQITVPAMPYSVAEALLDLYQTNLPFHFLHPVYGRLEVLFEGSLNIPKGEKGGRGAIRDLSLTLSEQVRSDNLFGAEFNNLWFSEFSFENYQISYMLPDEATKLKLGNNYEFAAAPLGKSEIGYELNFGMLTYFYDHDDNIHPTANFNANLAALELFYHQFRTDKPFTFQGKPCYFDEPLQIPAITMHGRVFDLTVKLRGIR